MPAEFYDSESRYVPRSKLLRFEEIERVSRLFAEMGVSKLRITGGEPLLRRELDHLVRGLRAIEGIEEIALTTNGILLPQQAEALSAAGLDRVTISLDSLDPEIFRSMADRENATVDEVLAGVEAAVRSGLTPIKINCVVRRGVNDRGVLELAEHFRHSGHILRFIEYMDVGTENGWRLDEVVPSAELMQQIEERHPLEALEPNYGGEVARRYRYRDGGGEIGFISSVSAPFCGGCHRARLTPEGQIYRCLFAETGIDLRTPLRRGMSDGSLRTLLWNFWTQREDRYSELRTAQTGERRRAEMYRLGG